MFNFVSSSQMILKKCQFIDYHWENKTHIIIIIIIIIIIDSLLYIGTRILLRLKGPGTISWHKNNIINKVYCLNNKSKEAKFVGDKILIKALFCLTCTSNNWLIYSNFLLPSGQNKTHFGI